jgi:peptide chain release factor 2
LTGVRLPSGGIFDLDARTERLTEVSRELEDPAVWNEPERAQELGRERARLEEVVDTLNNLSQSLVDADELLEMAAAENDQETLDVIEADLGALDADISRLEFRRMFSGEMDESNAFLDIQAGSGGTEAQDWAEMLLRMYLRWAEHHEGRRVLCLWLAAHRDRRAPPGSQVTL